MYFQDLTRYEYLRRVSERRYEFIVKVPGTKKYIIKDFIGDLYNVGWLDRKHRFAKGKVSDSVLRKILSLCEPKRHVNKTLGYHCCGVSWLWCTKTSVENNNGEKINLGSAEIRVYNKDRAYAAPDLIYHYISKHNYLPPIEFLTAVENTDLDNYSHYNHCVDPLGA